MSYEIVKKAVLDKDYAWFDGEMDPNFICERTSDEYTNSFTDHLHLCYTQEGQGIINSFRLTTKPGLYGDGAIMSDNKSSAGGATGTASVVPGQYRAMWTMRHLEQLKNGPRAFKGSPHYVPCMWQTGKVTVARDDNKNMVIDAGLIETAGLFGINFHYMGTDNTPNIFTDDNVNNWSVGCFGAPATTQYKIMMLLWACSQYSGTSVSLTLLESKDF